MKSKFVSSIEYIGFVIYVFGVPMLLYFLAKWDPIIGNDSYGDPVFLGFWPITLVYWVLIFLTYKYHNEKKIYKETLEKILSFNHALSNSEKTEIYEVVLGDYSHGKAKNG